MATAHDIGSPTAGASEVDARASTHRLRLRLKPPTYDGSYATFEEWKYKFSAHMGLQTDNIFPQLLSRAERATTVLTDAELLGAATTIEEGEKWTQLCNNLKYILINITSGPAATVCRQHQDAMGLEVYRQLRNRFAIPVGTRSIGYLTRLLKPKFDNNDFEESFSTWEFELARCERDNNAQLPDQVKKAVLMNEATGPLQQHLHLNASATPTYAEVRTTVMEYYRTTTAFSRLQQQSSSSVSTILEDAQLQWTLEQHTKAKEKERTNEKDMAKATKEKDTNKEKAMEATAHTTKEESKENNNHGTSQKEETKVTKERQKTCLAKDKERIQQRCATDVASQATWQRIAGQRCTICQRHHRNRTKM